MNHLYYGTMLFIMSHFFVEYDQDLRSQQYLTYLENSLIVLP